MMHSKSGKIGWRVAAALVVANMIGTGVFTSLGFQLTDIRHSWSIIILWLLGGAMAVIGAFSYAEVGSTFPKSGGEYHFLSRLYHPFIGYLAGWVSLLVGFAAPVALAAMALGAYTSNVLVLPPKALAIGTLVLISAIHCFNLKVSSRFQSAATWFKVLLIVFLIGAGLWHTGGAGALDFTGGWTAEISRPAFAIAFVFVTYSYTGWNAAAYIIGEVDRPAVNLPRALVRGALLVTLLYVLLQVVFLKHATLEELQGTLDVGHIFATNVFGTEGALLINLLIGLFLISSISAMTWVGPRVTMAMGEQYSLWRFLKRKNARGIPVPAIWFQTALGIVYVLTGTFESVLLYCGFILQLSAALTVAGVFVLRRRKEPASGFRSPGYPWLPGAFIVLSLWVLGYLLANQPVESLVGLLILLVGAGTYFLNRNRPKG